MKYLIFDAGPIISLSMNGLLGVLEKLKEGCDCEFVITPQVKREVVDRPIKMKKFKLEAVKVQNLLNRGVLKISNKFVNHIELNKETDRVLKISNGVIRSVKNNEKITILHDGEASCIAFSNLCGAANLIVIDERTTRILFESPDKIEHLMEKKLHSDLDVNVGLLKEVGQYKFIRSAELIYIAYKRDLIGLGKSKDVLDALLYALKFRGTTISSSEIDYLKKIG